MFCSNCGLKNNEDALFCSDCGNHIYSKNNTVSNDLPSQKTGHIDAIQSMNIGQSIATCLVKALDFKGRASRSEYWWFTIFNFLVVLFFVLNSYPGVSTDQSDTFLFYTNFYGFIVFLPGLSVSIRRLHDTNHSGWWILIGVTIIGLIPLYYWLLSKSDPEINRFSENQ